MSAREVTLQEFDKFIAGVDAHSTTAHNSLFHYDAVVWVSERAYRVSADTCYKTPKCHIEEITQERADALMLEGWNVSEFEENLA